MKRKQFTEQQIIGILKEHEAGAAVADLSRRRASAPQTSVLRPSGYTPSRAFGLSPSAVMCNPCGRYQVLPMCRVAQYKSYGYGYGEHPARSVSVVIFIDPESGGLGQRRAVSVSICVRLIQ
jgi:hypothetical protein